MPHRDHRNELTSPLTATAVYMVTTFYLVLLGASDYAAEFERIIHQPDSTLWCFLVAGQTAMWACLIPPLWRRVRPYANEIGHHRREVAGDLIALAILFMLFLLAHRSITGLKLVVSFQQRKIALLNGIGFATLGVSIVGMRGVAFAAQRLSRTGQDAGTLDRLASMRADLAWCLSIAGWILGAATLTTGALRSALRSLNPGATIPTQQATLVYGGFGCAVIALFYVTSYQLFLRSATVLLERVCPTENSDITAWLDRKEVQGKLAGVVGITTTTLQQFKEGAALLAPLAGSGIALLLGAK